MDSNIYIYRTRYIYIWDIYIYVYIYTFCIHVTCMYVCMYVSMYVCIHIYIYIDTCIIIYGFKPRQTNHLTSPEDRLRRSWCQSLEWRSVGQPLVKPIQQQVYLAQSLVCLEQEQKRPSALSQVFILPMIVFPMAYHLQSIYQSVSFTGNLYHLSVRII